MLKIKGFIFTFSLLVVLVSSESVDNRTTPVNGRLTTPSTPRPLAVEGSTAVRVGVTPGKSSSTVSRPITPTRVSSPERLDQTPARPTSSTASRAQTPVQRPPTPGGQDQSSSPSRPPTPSQSSSLRPTPSANPSSTTLRPTPSPAPLNKTESTTSRTTRSTPFSLSTSSPSTTTTPLTSTTSGISSTTSIFTISFSSSTISTSFPSSSTSELTSTTSFPSSSSLSPSISSSISSGSSSMSTESSSMSSSGSTLTSSTPSESTSSASSSPTSSTTSPGSSSGSSTPSSSATSSSSSSTTESTSSTSVTPTSTTVSTITPTSTTTTTASTSTPTTTTTTSTPATNTPTSTTISTSTPTTTTTIVTSSSTVSTTTTTQSVVVPAQTMHTQILFCNYYDSLNIGMDPVSISLYTNALKQQIQTICNVDPSRIQNFYLVKDNDGKALIQFDVIQGPGQTPSEIISGIMKKVKDGTLTVNTNSGPLTTNCGSQNVCPWTDNGICPDQVCQNGGRCNVAATCQYFCQCTKDWTGRYCEQRPVPPEPVKKKENLWLLWLLIVPLALLLLLLLLCCFCCMNRCCVGAAGAPRQKVEIIEEDIYQDVGGCSEHGTVRSCRSACSRPSIYAVNPNPMCVNDAGSTYYSALGRPFAVAFSDNTFSAVGYASNDAGIYNHCGKKVLPAASCCGDDEIEVIMNKPRRGSCCGSVYSETGSGYHSALGNRYAVAYNDRSFNTYSSMPRTCSIRHYN